MQRTSIAPDILQTYLESAANAAQKGQAQFCTPAAFAQACALPLPDQRSVVCDFQAGHGALIRAASNDTTATRLASDIQPHGHQLTADCTLLYPLLKDTGLRNLITLLNPPWDLWWYRSRLGRLADSSNDAVRAAFAAHDGRTTADTLDATVASLAMALDLAHDFYGEGFVIANAATAQRLLLDSHAPHAALAKHLWGWVRLPGNPMTERTTGAHDAPSATIVLYWHAGHEAGPQATVQAMPEAPLAEAFAQLRAARSRACFGPSQSYSHRHWAPDAEHAWNAAAEEYRRRYDPAFQDRHPYHIWLGAAGTIRTGLNLYEQQAHRFDRDQAKRLFNLNGKSPMQLVLMRHDRKELLSLAGLSDPARPDAHTPPDSPFRCDPALADAIHQALADYHAQRAPLYPLPTIQRLGYLDEEDTITCRHPLCCPNTGSPLFLPGCRYEISTNTVVVTRRASRLALDGQSEEVLYTGSELQLRITDEQAVPRFFMEGRLRDTTVRINDQPGVNAFDFTWEDLVATFDIPEVPDIARLQPAAYEDLLVRLHELESTLHL